MSLQVNSFPLIITLVLHCSQLTFLYFVRKKKTTMLRHTVKWFPKI